MSSMSSDPFLDQLAALARNEPTRNKWILVPHHQLGWTLAERLVREGCDWLNLRFKTPLQLALEAAGPEFWQRGIEPCPKQLGPALIQQLLVKHPEHPYAPLVLQPGLAQALWRFLRRQRLEGVAWEPLDGLFLEHLRQRAWADEAMVFGWRGSCRLRPEDLVVLYPYVHWPRAVVEFVRQLPAEQNEPWATETVRPAHWWNPRHQKPTHPRIQSSSFSAARPVEEIEEVIRRLDGPVDEVEIVAPTQLHSLWADLLAQHRLPATFASGLPLRLARPAQALLGLLEWLEQDVPGYQIRELLMSNMLVAPPNSWTAARLLAAARIRWGRADYAARFRDLRERSSGQDWLKIQAGQVRLLEDWFQRVFQLFPEQGRVSEWCRGFQSMLAREIDQHDQEASQILQDLLEELAQLEAHWDFSTFAFCLRDRIQSLVWKSSQPLPGHLHVTAPHWLGLSGRSVLFITSQSECPPPPVSPLSPPHRLAEEAFQVRERMACLQAKATWSYARTSLEGEPQYPLGEFEYSAVPRRDEPRPSLAEVWARFPDLERGFEAERQRLSAKLTVYDGYVPSAAELMLDKTFSCYRLQMLATCPFRFFLQHGLGIYPQPLPMPDRNQWLDPIERGQVLHKLFQGVESLDEILAQFPPAPSKWLESWERRKLMREFEHFQELAGAGREVLGRELAFERLLVQAGTRQLQLQGCIDRIEQLESGLRVIDFKTGRSFELSPEGYFFQGRQLQHAIYAVAAESLFLERVQESVYCCTHLGARQSSIAFPAPEPEALKAALGLVIEPLARGTFSQSHRGQRDCRYCDHRAACVGRQDELVEAKLEAPRRQLLELK